MKLQRMVVVIMNGKRIESGTIYESMLMVMLNYYQLGQELRLGANQIALLSGHDPYGTSLYVGKCE